MSDYAGKRITIRFCTEEVIDLIESLPKGYKSMIVESAVEIYRKSEIGKNLISQLKERNKKHAVRTPPPLPPPPPKKSDRIDHYTGDF